LCNKEHLVSVSNITAGKINEKQSLRHNISEITKNEMKHQVYKVIF